MRTCPHCAEEVQDQAVICKHCKNRLPALPKPRICEECGKVDTGFGFRCSACKQITQSGYMAMPLAVILLPILLYIGFDVLTAEPSPSPSPSTNYAQPTPDPEYSRRIEVQSCTQLYVERMLRSPSTAKHPWVLASDVVTKVSEGQYRISSYVDAENAFSAMIRQYYTCDVTLLAEECSDVICEFD